MSILQQKAHSEPRWYFDRILGVTLWSKQEDIVISVRDNVYTTVRSNNSSGKTFGAASLALWFLTAFGPAVVIDTAPTHRQVENQFWRELRRAYKRSKVPLGGKLLKTQLNIDENWFAIGFSTSKGEDGMEAFQGWHAENILIIVDEASGVSPLVFQAIEGAMAGGKTVRILLIGNPTRNTGDFADSFKDPRYNKIHISAFDTPNYIAGKIVVPGLATREWVEGMKLRYGEDSDIYRVRVKGDFPRKDSDTLIPLELVEGAIGAEREEFGEEEVIGLDPARFGNNKAAFVHRKGNRARILEIVDSSDLMVLAGKGKAYLKQFPNAKLHIDIIGVGAGVFDRLREQPSIAGRVYGVNSAGKPYDKESFVNIRIESWDAIKHFLKDGILDRHTQHGEGWYQLAQPKYKINSSGQLLLESKEDMGKRGVQSPDVADALALTLARTTEGGEMDFAYVG